MALWSLSDTTSAARRAEHYANQLDLAEKLDASQWEIALRVVNLPASRQASRDVERIKLLEKSFEEGLESLNGMATDDEDRGLVSDIAAAATPWRDSANRMVASVQAGKRSDAATIREEPLVRLEALKSAVSRYIQYRQQRAGAFQLEQQARVAAVRAGLIGGG